MTLHLFCPTIRSVLFCRRHCQPKLEGYKNQKVLCKNCTDQTVQNNSRKYSLALNWYTCSEILRFAFTAQNICFDIKQEPLIQTRHVVRRFKDQRYKLCRRDKRFETLSSTETVGECWWRTWHTHTGSTRPRKCEVSRMFVNNFAMKLCQLYVCYLSLWEQRNIFFGSSTIFWKTMSSGNLCNTNF